jgi:hypothetical protein
MQGLKSQQRSRLDQSEMFNWKRLFTDLGWAMSMTDPMCYSYYLASRLDSTDGKGTHDIASPTMALRSLRDRDHARPPAPRRTKHGKLTAYVTAYPGQSVTRQDAP